MQLWSPDGVRFVFFSDTHLGFDLPVTPRSARPRRGGDFFANFERVIGYARRTRPDLLVHGGDLFFRSRVHAAIVDRAYRALFELADEGIPVAIVPGNHDGSVLPASLLLNHPNLHVFDRPRTFRFDVRGERVALVGIPYLKSVRSRFGSALASCGSDPASEDHRVLCMHHAVEGAVVGPGSFRFGHGPDVVPAGTLPTGFDAVLSGHIHRRQLLEHRTPVVYCGSIERTSFAEQGETKGFCEIELDRDELAPRIVFHDLPARPMVDFDARDIASGRLLVDALSERVSGWPPGAFVRIRVSSYPSARLRCGMEQLISGPLAVSVPARRSL